MKTVGATQLTVDGYREEIIANKLKWYYDNSTKIKSHIDTAANLGVKIKAYSGNGKCMAKDGTVHLYWGGCHDGVNELFETSLFEINNAIHQKSGAYDKINKKLTSKGFLQIGLLSAVKESESTTVVVQLLNDLATGGYTISNWGIRQKNAVEGSGDFKMHFANAVHDRNAPSGDEQTLKSKHMYAYQRVKAYEKTGKGLSVHRYHFWSMADATPPTKTQSLGSQDYKEMFDYFARDTDISALGYDQFIVYYITVLENLASPYGWTINWKRTDAYCGTWVQFKSEIAQKFGLNQDIHGIASQKILNKFLDYE